MDTLYRRNGVVDFLEVTGYIVHVHCTSLYQLVSRGVFLKLFIGRHTDRALLSQPMAINTMVMADDLSALMATDNCSYIVLITHSTAT